MGKRQLPVVSENGVLVGDEREGQPLSILIESEDWYQWLAVEQNSSFAFQHAAGAFTVRRERKGANWYWYAYRKRKGKLHKAYLGKSHEVTLQRLNVAAMALAGLDADTFASDTSLPHLSIPTSDHVTEDELAAHRRDALQKMASTLPAYLTPLLGREQEVQTVSALLQRPEVRLVTLTGPGGIGKTRLGVQIATQLFAHFSDGASFVPLAPLSDPDLVVAAIAQVMGLRDTGDWSLFERLKTYLRSRQLLLLLDNFEHLLQATPQLVELLTSCPGVKILVTSRAVLRVSGEHEFQVSPLALPDLTQLPAHGSLLQYAAIELFLQRVWAIKHTFQLTSTNARPIVEVCVKLEGLPLALELAAARIKLLSPRALLTRLEHQLPLLTYGAGDVPERQQTLRNTIRWSYDLLSPTEQRLFRRVSVFVGGFTIEAVEYLYTALGASALNVLDGLTSLLDKSLMQSEKLGEDEPRLFLLEAIREYGLECLTVHGEMEMTHQAYSAYYLMIAEEAKLELQGPQQDIWLERLEREHGNLRKVLAWLLKQEEIEQALRLGVALARFWEVHGHLSEGYHWLDWALTSSQNVAASLRAWGLSEAAWLICLQGKSDQAERLLRESLSLFQTLDDKRGRALALRRRGVVARLRGRYGEAGSLAQEALLLFKEAGERGGVAHVHLLEANLAIDQGEYVKAGLLLEECLSVFRELRDKRRTTLISAYLALVLFAQGDLVSAHTLAQESLALAKSLGDKETLALALRLCGQYALRQGDLATARSLFAESLTLARERGHQHGIAEGLSLFAKVATIQGDYQAAQSLFEESLAFCREGGKEVIKTIIASCLEGLADLFLRLGKSMWAVRLWGMSELFREEVGVPMMPIERLDYERAVAAGRSHLGKRTFAATWAEGRRMTLEQVLAAVTALPPPTAAEIVSSAPPTTKPVGFLDALTPREVEVLRLLAQGLTDTQIAEQLILSRRTISWYLSTIYHKLGVSSRSAATHFAMNHHLV